MNTLIVYYSLEGNTEYAAGPAASAPGAELVLIDPKTKPNEENGRKIQAFCRRLGS